MTGLNLETLAPLNSGRPKVVDLIRRLKTYVVDWKFTFVPAENVVYEPGIDREVADMDEANIVSSERKTFAGGPTRHAVLLDIDYPAYVVESSTPGHHHVYLDVPNGVAHDDYMELVALLGRIGVVEPGYAEVSVKRGHTDLRLPWVRKEDQKIHKDDEPDVNLKHIPVPDSPADPFSIDFDALQRSPL